MKTTFIDILKENQERKRKYFTNYRFYAEQIKKETELVLKQVKIIIFGSVVKDEWGPNSDIDILIISEKMPASWIERRNIRTNIKSKIGLFNPFQIHLATPEEYENWYKNFIKEDYEII